MDEYINLEKYGWRIICRRGFLDALNELFPSPVEFIRSNLKKIYMESPNLVAEFRYGNEKTASVKIFGWRSFLQLLLSPFRKSKAMRSFFVARRLIDVGLWTPEPLCVMERRRFGFIISNIYITEVIADYITVRDYLQKHPDGYQASKNILPYLAEYLRNMHGAGIWHRDLHLSNFLMKKNTRGAPVFYLVDLNRAKLFRELPEPLKIFDIGKMDLHEFRADFLDIYLGERMNRIKLERIFYIYVLMRRLRKRALKWYKV